MYRKGGENLGLGKSHVLLKNFLIAPAILSVMKMT